MYIEKPPTIGRLSFCLYDENAVRYFVLALPAQVAFPDCLQAVILPAILQQHIAGYAAVCAALHILGVAGNCKHNIDDLITAAVAFICRFLHWLNHPPSVN